MKVISKYPVVRQCNYSRKFSGVDGDSSPDMIMLFQKWAYEKRGAGVPQDGEWDRATKRAWKKYGADFNKFYNIPGENKEKFFDKVKNLFGKYKGEQTPETSSEQVNPSEEEPQVNVQVPYSESEVIVDKTPAKLPVEPRGITTGDIALLGLGLYIAYQIFFRKDTVTVKINQPVKA